MSKIPWQGLLHVDNMGCTLEDNLHLLKLLLVSIQSDRSSSHFLENIVDRKEHLELQPNCQISTFELIRTVH